MATFSILDLSPVADGTSIKYQSLVSTMAVDSLVERMGDKKLVDLSKHDYKLEPNVTFTPDGEWIVFRSNLHGPSHVYAVEVRKAKSAAAASPE